MLIVANVYIWDVLCKQRHSVIITVAVHFKGGDSTNARPIISLLRQKACFWDDNSISSHKFRVASTFFNKTCIKIHTKTTTTYTCMQRVKDPQVELP